MNAPKANLLWALTYKRNMGKWAHVFDPNSFVIRKPKFGGRIEGQADLCF